MPLVCLPEGIATRIKRAIKTGKISPDKLKVMTSAERRSFLARIVGVENAQEINLLFERKMLLKDQEKAMYSWATDITGMSKKAKAETLAKIKQAFADKQRRLFEPAENEKFLNEITSDAFSKKYRTEVSLEEAQKITELTSGLRKAKAKMNPDFTWNTKQEGLDFGASKVALDNYVGDLKLEAGRKEFISPFRAKGIFEKGRAIGEDVGIIFDFVAANSRSIVASVDNSWWGRQGRKTLVTNPRAWGRNFLKSWDDMYKILRHGKHRGDSIIDGVKAEIYSRKNYLNGRYQRGIKLDIGTGEEAFPTSAPAKIPFFGRIFKASEIAYEAGAMRMRVDVADQVYTLAEKNGIDLADKFEVGSLNEVVNSLTGRGRLKIAEGAQATVNKAFFSIKFFKSNWDTLTLHTGSKLSPFARKLAAINLLKIISSIGVILGTAWAFKPESVEWNLTSANSGKLTLGNTRFDITGGMASLVTVVSRILAQSTKSSVTEITTELGEGYMAPTGMDVLWNFTENKFSPMFSVIKAMIEQKTFEGEKPTITTTAKGLGVPIIIQEGFEIYQDPNSANIILSLIAEGLGISANTYSFKTNWENSTSKELIQFNATIGKEEFQKANDRFNTEVNEFILEVRDDEDYQALTDEDKKQLLTWKKNKIKQEIFEDYDFKYKEGEVPEFDDGEEVNNNSIIDTVLLYAKAIKTDPVTAFNRIFTWQRIRKLSNDAVIVERMPLSESQEVKEERDATDEMMLDHTIPLQLGGSNSKSNLKLVPRGEWQLYTPIENHLGRLLRAEEIDKKTAQQLIKEFKEGTISAQRILEI